MSAGTPNYQQVAAQLIATNNELRDKLNMPHRELAVLQWEKIAGEIREENKELTAKLEVGEEAKAKPVASRRGRPRKNEVKEETPSEEDEGEPEPSEEEDGESDISNE